VISRRKKQVRIIFAVLMSALLCPAGSWSGGQTVKPGDQANVHFTCRLKNGEVAASSYPSVAVDPEFRKSAIFVPRTMDAPLSIVAGEPSPVSDSNEERGLEGEIVNQLSGAIVGLPIGERQTREIRAERRQERKKGDYFLQMARVRQRVKEMHLTPDEYKFRTGKAAEVGQTFVIDPAVPGKVSSVTESEVVVRFFAKAGEKVATPFGEGTVKELPDRYDIVIDARPGTLVRSGGYVGRITSVDERIIAIDYSHPFGGEALLCDTVVESAEPGTK
jgi:FKBP-type peptidyl-prolyl cis-trans isomerase 2